MKVIKKGREQKGWAQEFTCTGKGNGDGGCGAVLLVEEDDIYITKSGCRTTEQYNTFRCCECKVETDLLDNEIPARIREEMTTKCRARERSRNHDTT